MHVAHSVDFILPAHNEANTVADVARVCVNAAEKLGHITTTVTVIADHCTDATPFEAEVAGADVIVRADGAPSKADAVRAGIVATSGEVIALIDADCRNLESAHLLKLVEPILIGEADQSVGVMDYGVLSRLVRRYPWSSGQRALRREAFNWFDSRMAGYNLEMLINEAIGSVGGTTLSYVLEGVTHRSMLVERGWREGLQRDVRMWRDIADVVKASDNISLKTYFESVSVADRNVTRFQSRLEGALGYYSMRLATSLLCRTSSSMPD